VKQNLQLDAFLSLVAIFLLTVTGMSTSGHVQPETITNNALEGNFLTRPTNHIRHQRQQHNSKTRLCHAPTPLRPPPWRRVKCIGTSRNPSKYFAHINLTYGTHLHTHTLSAWEAARKGRGKAP